MSDYKIGILTIGYNRANNLLRLLNSINAATFPTDDVDLLISIDNSGTKDVEMVVKPGDIVLFGKYSGIEVELEKDKFLLMKQDDIFMITNRK